MPRAQITPAHLSLVPTLEPKDGGAPIADRARGHRKILIVDIERLPGLAQAFQSKVEYIGWRNWVKWPSTVCLAYKWYGSDEPVVFLNAWGKGGEEAMLRKIWKVYDEAEIVVTYNGVGFDNKHLASGWATIGMAPPSPWKDIDLLRVVRSRFGFESKAMQPVSERLGMKGKHGHYDVGMALAAFFGDREARAELRAYNEQDVLNTEDLYDRLRPWIKNHPHVSDLPADGTRITCPNCGSTDLRKNGKQAKQVLVYQRFRCRGCETEVLANHHLDNSRIGYTRTA